MFHAVHCDDNVPVVKHSLAASRKVYSVLGHKSFDKLLAFSSVAHYRVTSNLTNS